MTINCVWEHNGNDTLLYATNFVGAYTRGESLEIAKAKMPQEIVSYCNWLGMEAAGQSGNRDRRRKMLRAYNSGCGFRCAF